MSDAYESLVCACNMK